MDHVSFTIRPGEILGYLGPNGSGKSTTVKMLTGLISPSEGDLFFFDSNLKDDPIGYRGRLSYIPEEPFLYSHLSGREYLQLIGRRGGRTASGYFRSRRHRKGTALAGVAPVVLLTLLLLAVTMGTMAALLYTTFVALMSLVLSEGLLWNWDRIPFTCPYLPGKRYFIQSLLLYGIALTLFAYMATAVEMSTIQHPARRGALYGILFAALAFLRFHRKKNWTSGIPLKFGDLPEPDVQKLNLQPE